LEDDCQWHDDDNDNVKKEVEKGKEEGRRVKEDNYWTTEGWTPTVTATASNPPYPGFPYYSESTW
jgi:hypothetical protein